MEDLAREIVSNLKRKDRKSHFTLQANNVDNWRFSILEVKAPIENGSVIFKVTNEDHPEIEYRQEDFESVVSLIDFFFDDQARSWVLFLKTSEGLHYKVNRLEKGKIDRTAKIGYIEAAVRALLTK